MTGSRLRPRAAALLVSPLAPLGTKCVLCQPSCLSSRWACHYAICGDECPGEPTRERKLSAHISLPWELETRPYRHIQERLLNPLLLISLIW